MIDRANRDLTFREELLQNPREAIEAQSGISLPATITIRVIKEQLGEVVLVLPARSTASGTTLSDADLEAVARGFYLPPPTDVGGLPCTQVACPPS